MSSAKKYFQDRIVLLLLSITIFLSLLAVILVLFRLDSVSGTNPIIQYRENLGVNAFKSGVPGDHYRFVVFPLLVGAFHIFLSLKAYHIRKHFSYTVLGLGILLVILNIIVSSELIYHS